MMLCKTWFSLSMGASLKSWQIGPSLSKYLKVRTQTLLILLTVSLSSSCGYLLRGNTRPFFEKRGIKSLYIPPVKNNSYKAGVEITVYNALRKRVREGGYVKIVSDPKSADAELNAIVIDAKYEPQGYTTTDQIASSGQKGPTTVQIAPSYNVTLNVQFTLLDNKSGKKLWSDTLQRQKSFNATTYLGTLGSTSALINESDFERTLGDLSVSTVTDAEESINSIF